MIVSIFFLILKFLCNQCMTAGHICKNTLFESLQCSQRIHWLFDWIMGAPFPGVKWPRPEVDHWPACSAEVTNE